MKRYLRGVTLAVFVLFVAIVLVAVVQSRIASAVSPVQVAQQTDGAGRLRPLADVIEHTRALKLVTVEVCSAVESTSESDIWRGRAAATIMAPVRYLYGVDLSELERSLFSLNSLTGTYALRIPRPCRLATEVDTANAFEERVDVTGTRTRGRAGETQLSLARKQLSEEAQRQTLSPEQLEQIEEETLEQVREALCRIAGTDKVEVSYK